MIFRLALISVLAAVLPAPALSADRGDDAVRYRNHPWQSGPYPLSRRAAKLRRAERCWHGCLAEAGRGFQACLRVHGLNDCLPRNDAADRYCLRACRLGGGPWVRLAE